MKPSERQVSADSSADLRDVSGAISDAILILDQNGVASCNEGCIHLFGATTHDQLLGRSFQELVSSEDTSITASRHESVRKLRMRVPPTMLTIRRLDGSLKTVECQTSLLPQPGSEAAIVEVLRSVDCPMTPVADVSSEIQVRNILDSAMDGIISVNESQEVVLFNPAAEAIFGYQSAEIIGQSLDVLIPTRFRQHHHSDVETFGKEIVERRRMGVQRTVLALRSSGEEFPIEASISKSFGNGRRLYTVILRDVTEAVRYRQQIEQQSQMLDQVSEAISVVGLNGQITYWNQAASRLFGWTADEMIGASAADRLYRDPQILRDIIAETTALNSWSGEVTKQTRSGTPVIVEHRRSILRDTTSATIGYLCVDIDITARKKREQIANRGQRLESIGTLAGGIAHDLNNVLTPIMMGIRVLKSDCNSKSEDLLDIMQASAERGADLVKQVLSFAGGIRGERSPVSIKQLITETSNLLEHTLNKTVQIETSADEDCPLVLGDATELSQVLMNLCINARDAMPDGGKLMIGLATATLGENANQLNPEAHPGNYVVLSVSDTGTGMSMETIERIFDPFFTTKEVGKGTGLGLATVQGIVKSHGGFINVYSELENGTKFSIFLPAHLPSSSRKKVSKTTDVVQACADGQGQGVLLVDDEESILQMTRLALEVAGYKVFTANNGIAALRVFSQHRPEIDAVILDMMMPGIDGLRTLEQLREIDASVPIIASSGLRTHQREIDAMTRGARAFLPKPYSEEKLVQVLAAVLTNQPP